MTKTKKMGLTLMLLMFPAAKTLFAQVPGEIRGKILEKKNVGALGIMVWVDLNGSKLKTMTDDEGTGSFTLKPLDAGTYIVHVQTQTDTINLEVIVNANSITRMPSIDLSDPEYASNKLDEFEIIKWKDPLINIEGASMTIVRAKELVHSPAKHDIKQIVASQTSGVKVTESGDAYVRGSRSDATIYYIDGVKLREGFRSPPANAIASLAVYTGGVPAKYGDCTGGVVVVETKSYFSLYNEWIAEQNKQK